jgi:hypothetical protein
MASIQDAYRINTNNNDYLRYYFKGVRIYLSGAFKLGKEDGTLKLT